MHLHALWARVVLRLPTLMHNADPLFAPQQTTADLVAAIEQWVASRNVQASANYIVQDAASLLTRAADALKAKDEEGAAR